MCRPTIVEVSEWDFEPIAADVVPKATTTAEPKQKAKKEKKSKGKPVPQGDDKVLAERFRTKRCKTFIEKGKCPYESRCMFAHGDENLRTTKQNLKDGLTSEEAIRQFKKLETLKRRAQAAEERHRRLEQSWSASHEGSSDCYELSSAHSEESNSEVFTLTVRNGEAVYMHNPYGFKALPDNAIGLDSPHHCDVVGARLYRH